MDAAFTLLEVMLAILILSTAMLAIMETLARSMNAVSAINNTYTAIELLSIKLGELDVLEEIEEGFEEGDFEELRPGYRWTTDITLAEQTDLYRVQVAVLWEEQGQEVSEKVETYLYRRTEGPRSLSETLQRARSGNR